jgi:hypothetical protein
MSKGASDIFALMTNVLKSNWMFKQMTIGMFAAMEIIDQTLTTNTIELFDQYRLIKNITTYVKDEGSNLIIMTTTLKSIVKCEVLGLYESFQHTCFGHVFSKVCYATIDENVCKTLRFISIKYAYSNL